jgi:glyoxylase-like metal-dependent hydrolase (beta-lactamase superfamily II)
MAVSIPFRRELKFEYGVAATVSPLIRRVICRNPSAFTFHGTGTYIVGKGKVAVVDPGPDDAAHVAALTEALKGETVTHHIITHTHRDHSPATAPFKKIVGGTSYGFGPHGSGRSGGVHDEVEEGGDMAFKPDVTVRDGDVIEGDGWTLEAVYTPGHTSNHICYALREENALFPGDHVMGWSTTIVSPPDGDMLAYMTSLEKLLKRNDARYWPTHGTFIDDPKTFVTALLEHRRDRERQIIDCLKQGICDIKAMVKVMYADVNPGLHPAAARSVLSHLIHMIDTKRVACDGEPRLSATYRLP